MSAVAFDPEIWLTRQRVTDAEAVYLAFGIDPPARQWPLPSASMNEFWRWMDDRALIHSGDPIPIPGVIFVDSYVLLAELMEALRTQQGTHWGKPLLLLDRDNAKADERRLQAMIKKLKEWEIPENQWLSLGTTGRRKDDLFTALQDDDPQLFRSRATFDKFFKAQTRVRFK